MNDHERYPDCVLDTTRFFDPATGQWGYAVDCFAEDHAGAACPAEREMFREEPEQWWLDRRAGVS